MGNGRAAVARLRAIFCLPAVLFSIALTVALVIGRSFFLTNGLSYIIGSAGAIVRAGVRALLYFLVISVVSSLLMRWLASERGRLPDALAAPTGRISGLLFGEARRTIVLLWAVIFICWVPCLLAYWPGIFSYDIMGELPQGVTEPFNTIQPLLYTLYVKTVYALTSGGGTAAGMLWVAITQMVMLSALFAVTIWRLNRLHVHVVLRALCLAWFALYPSIPIFAIAETKDTLFAGVFALTTVFLIELARDPALFFAKAEKPVGLGILLLLLCLLRSNGVLVLFLLGIAMVLQHKTWKVVIRKLLAMIAGPLFIAVAVVQVLLPAFGINGLSRMMLSVPVQQIAYTHKVAAPNLAQRDLDAINYWILADIDNMYNPRLADPIMLYSRDVGFTRPSFGFLAAWVRVGLTHPAEYTEAFLTLTLQSWYPGSAFPDQYAQRYYIETNNYPQAGVLRQSKAPLLLGFYQAVAVDSTWQHVPVVSLLFDTGVPVWFMLFGLALAIKRKQRRDMIVYLMPLALLTTIMLGPVINGRYMFPFFVCFPLWLVPLLSGGSPARLDESSEATARA